MNLTGENLDIGNGPSVYINNGTCMIMSKNSESLYCAVPAGNTGSADVQVHIDGNAVEKKIPPNAFKYVDDPTISEIDPLKSIQR